MHHNECIQLPQKPKVLHANGRFYPSKENRAKQKLLPRMHHNECIQLPQILVLHVHTNKQLLKTKKLMMDLAGALLGAQLMTSQTVVRQYIGVFGTRVQTP